MDKIVVQTPNGTDLWFPASPDRSLKFVVSSAGALEIVRDEQGVCATICVYASGHWHSAAVESETTGE